MVIRETTELLADDENVKVHSAVKISFSVNFIFGALFLQADDSVDLK